MSMRKRKGEKQADLWIPTTELARSPGHPFFERLNKVLSEAGFAQGEGAGTKRVQQGQFFLNGPVREALPEGALALLDFRQVKGHSFPCRY